jgi:hypothetical protein
LSSSWIIAGKTAPTAHVRRVATPDAEAVLRRVLLHVLLGRFLTAWLVPA